MWREKLATNLAAVDLNSPAGDAKGGGVPAARGCAAAPTVRRTARPWRFEICGCGAVAVRGRAGVDFFGGNDDGLLIKADEAKHRAVRALSEGPLHQQVRVSRSKWTRPRIHS